MVSIEIHNEIEQPKVRFSFETWVMEEGAAAALSGCLLFWLVVGVTLYFAL